VNSSSLATSVDTFKADFKNQQLKAMLGDTEGGSAPDNYGIHFDTNSYTLFRGPWSASDPNNFTVNLPPSIEVTTTFIDEFSESLINFEKGTGIVGGCCTESGSTITLIDTTANIEKTLTIGRYGAFSEN
jgi:hypothetical protein